ncbi:MAG: hypothetical protein J1D77_06540 [Muribaculaceae bacterium]|nr:hypothetical protein [Muribaculaceae bacterium]
MKEKGDARISYWAAHLTTTVSVTLVLLLLGIITFITLSSEKETRTIRERLEVSVVMGDTVSDASAERLSSLLSSRPYALEAGYIGKAQALKDWQEETGEDLETLFGVNPLSPEVYFRVKADYSSPDSLRVIENELKVMPGVEEVVMPDSEMVEAMNSNIQSLAIILGIVALVMVIVSFVLINNTVHLSIYARRFTIHTMQLVGATDGFIRRPFIVNNLLAGLMASLVASGILAISLGAAPHMGWNDVAHYISWGLFACVAGGMIIAGPLICCVAAAIATSRYLGKDYDDLVRS